MIEEALERIRYFINYNSQQDKNQNTDALSGVTRSRQISGVKEDYISNLIANQKGYTKPLEIENKPVQTQIENINKCCLIKNILGVKQNE